MAAALITGPQMRAINAAAEAGYKGRSTNIPRRLIEHTAELWRKLPCDGCLSQSVTLDGYRLAITDVRITASTATKSTWGDGSEIGVCIIANSLTMGKKRMLWQAPIIIGCSLHSIARWHQRALLTTPEALLSDLKLLTTQAPSIIAAGTPTFAVPTNGGAWKGLIAVSPDQHTFCDIRTFAWT